jgi:hypothetical protein
VARARSAEKRLTEAEIQTRFIKNARRRGMFAVKLRAVGQVGFPDVLLVWRGRSVFTELKAKDTRVSPKQKRVITDMVRSGAGVHVLRGLDAAIQFLDDLQKEPA